MKDIWYAVKARMESLKGEEDPALDDELEENGGISLAGLIPESVTDKVHGTAKSMAANMSHSEDGVSMAEMYTESNEECCVCATQPAGNGGGPCNAGCKTADRVTGVKHSALKTNMSVAEYEAAGGGATEFNAFDKNSDGVLDEGELTDRYLSPWTEVRKKAPAIVIELDVLQVAGGLNVLQGMVSGSLRILAHTSNTYLCCRLGSDLPSSFQFAMACVTLKDR